jgi:hypothetical protein
MGLHENRAVWVLACGVSVCGYSINTGFNQGRSVVEWHTYGVRLWVGFTKRNDTSGMKIAEKMGGQSRYLSPLGKKMSMCVLSCDRWPKKVILVANLVFKRWQIILVAEPQQKIYSGFNLIQNFRSQRVKKNLSLKYLGLAPLEHSRSGQREVRPLPAKDVFDVTERV